MKTKTFEFTITFEQIFEFGAWLLAIAGMMFSFLGHKNEDISFTVAACFFMAVAIKERLRHQPPSTINVTHVDLGEFTKEKEQTKSDESKVSDVAH